MRSRFLGRKGLLATGLRFAVVMPVALVFAVLVVKVPVRDAPGFGGDSLACAVMMGVDAPTNWWLFVAIFATSSALASYGVDRLLTRGLGVQDWHVSGGLAAGVFAVVGIALAMTEFGIFC